MRSENLHLNQTHPTSLQQGALQRLTDTLLSWQRRARERAELAHLDAWNLRDLGLSEGDVALEASKSCWKA
jgi:uncharacterized protein YjiS (DUF1127 family)